MNPARIVIVEDEEDIAELIRFNLNLESFQTSVFSDGLQALKHLQEDKPDLVLLDIMLPGMGGLDICRRLREQYKSQDLPIIMISAKGAEADIVRGLEMGADDYISKPFSTKILVARVKAGLRRNASEKLNQQDLQIHDIQMHTGRHEVRVDGQIIKLTNSEFQILYFLAQRPGWVFTRSQIVDAIRGENYAVTERSIDFQMVGLRKKMMHAGAYIETVRGVGYRFKEEA